MLIQLRIPPSKSEIVGWSLSDRNAKPSLLNGGSVRITTHDTNGHKISLQTKSGPIVIKTSEILYRFEPTKVYGSIGKLAGSIFGVPSTTTFRASALDGSLKGILEVSEIR